MAVLATFTPSTGILSVFGDSLPNAITIARNAAGVILVNGGAVKILGGTSTVANTKQIQVFGLNGDDMLFLDESNGALPAAQMFGGSGNDVITGGSGGDLLFGQSGNDTLLGKGGNDQLFGGDGNDTLTGGDGDDMVFGGAGNDRMIWNPGDDTDLFEGGSGTDTAEVNGGNGAEQFTVTANGTRVRFDRVNPAPFSLDIGTTEKLVVNMNGGDDSFSATGNLAALIELTVDGGTGNDTILGSNGNDTLLGGDGNDFIDGQQGNDVILLGAGDDTFQWDPGDGNDIVEGQDGTDTMKFNGANIGEIFDISANGGRTRFTRNVANIVMDLNDVEHIELNALGGADTITVGDLSGTDVTQVNVKLAATIGGTTGDAAADTVIVNGTNGANTINVSGNGTSASVTGLPALVNVTGIDAANDTLVVNGLGGDDVISASGLAAGVIKVTLDGGAGNDTLIGSQGHDVLRGGDGNDTITGRAGDDIQFGGAGDDRFVWNPGDGTDLVEGEAGNDTAEVNGGNGAEQFTLTANGNRVRFDRVNPAPFSLDIGTTENLVVNMNGGDDTFSATGNIAALIKLTVDGGNGNDTILGSNGNDLLLGGDGNDFIDGQQGNDTVLLGAGDDVFQWDPGDGSDVVEGQAGTDTMLFNGSAASENFAISANGGRVLFTRNVGNIVMDLNDVEKIELNTLGGTDLVTVNDLSGTDVTEVNVKLAGTIGGTAGDAQPDTVIVNGTNGNNIINVFGAGSSVSVIGLSTQVNITGSEGANDTLVINALGGNDGITATTMAAGVIKLTIDAGAGDDTVLGSQGADTIFGGDGNDFIFGDNGNDVAFMGAGNDVFQWDPGDGNDTIEGQDGNDLMLFFGSNASENIDISANGGRVRFFRDVANVTMDLNDVERIEYRAIGGADNITVGDLSGTDVTRVDIDLRGPNGGPDGSIDTVTVNGSQGANTFGVTGDSGGVTVFGLQATTNLFFTDANDRLVLNGLGGDDVIDAGSLEAGAVQLTINGGLGNDLMIGSEGDDLIIGGDGNDVALMGAGNDTFVWSPGDDNDTVEGQAGSDTMLFNGANIAENIGISANGGRVLFTRNVANVTMDLNDVETIDFHALGGADTITVNDMSGTDLEQVNIDLSASGTGGAGDGAADTIVINATNGDDVIQIFGDNTGVTIVGLGQTIHIVGFDASDRIVINGLGGDDVIEASGLNAVIKLTGNGGDGDDVLIGSEGNDVLTGGAGDDVLLGGPGVDVLDGGLGDNIEIQNLVAQQPQFLI